MEFEVDTEVGHLLLVERVLRFPFRVVRAWLIPFNAAPSSRTALKLICVSQLVICVSQLAKL